MHFAPLNAPSGQLLRDYFEVDKKIDSIILIRSHGAYIKSCAALRMTLYMRGLWPLLAVFLIIPPFLRNPLYDLVAKNRMRFFGRVEQCALLKGEEQARFFNWFFFAYFLVLFYYGACRSLSLCTSAAPCPPVVVGSVGQPTLSRAGSPPMNRGGQPPPAKCRQVPRSPSYPCGHWRGVDAPFTFNTHFAFTQRRPSKKHLHKHLFFSYLNV